MLILARKVRITRTRTPRSLRCLPTRLSITPSARWARRIPSTSRISTCRRTRRTTPDAPKDPAGSEGCRTRDVSDWNEETGRRRANMNEIEKRELIEQQRKIFEAGTQRADKRTGFFSFLTWSFFTAPLIASKEVLAAASKSAVAAEEDAIAAQKGAVVHVANDDLPVADPSKTSGET